MSDGIIYSEYADTAEIVGEINELLMDVNKDPLDVNKDPLVILVREHEWFK